MANQKDILVLTTSTTEGLIIKKHLKPVSAHLVAGTNLFSDFLGGLTDVFGGRSSTYQRQLSSLYNEAIELIKQNAYEIGANCVVGLTIDMDEISGKGKSMFMLTAIGTALIIDESTTYRKTQQFESFEKLEKVGFEKINNLKLKIEIIEKADKNSLSLDEKTWDFIKKNQVSEVFNYIIDANRSLIKSYDTTLVGYKSFTDNFIHYISSLEDYKQIQLLYTAIKDEEDDKILEYLVSIIQEMNLLNLEEVMELLNNKKIQIQKVALKILTFDKPFYDKDDVITLVQIVSYIEANFKQRGEITSKKQLLSSKEKDVWNCECGSKSIDIGQYCGNCFNDIYGFQRSEETTDDIIFKINQKVKLINTYLQ